MQKQLYDWQEFWDDLEIPEDEIILPTKPGFKGNTEPADWVKDSRGRAVRLDKVIMNLHLSSGRFAVKSVTTMAKKKLEKAKEQIEFFVGNQAAKLIPKELLRQTTRQLLTVVKFFEVLSENEDIRWHILAGNLISMRDVHDKSALRRKTGPRRRVPVSTRHPMKKQRWPNGKQHKHFPVGGKDHHHKPGHYHGK